MALNSLAQIDGTADADIADFNKAEIRISTGVATKYYWTGSSWTLTDTWLNSTKLGPTSWYYTVDAAMLADDTEYTVSAKALDYAGNYSSVYSTYTFTYDITEPLVTLDFPEDGEAYSQILVSTPIAGTSSNNQTSVNTGVSTIAVQIQDIVDANCFDGSSFSACPQWLPAQGTVGAWNFEDNNLLFTNDHRYNISAKAIDFAGNESVISLNTVDYDVEKPTASITYPQAGYFVGFIPFVNGEPTGEWEVFADGFAQVDPIVSVKDAIYRPMGIAMGPDGSLYLSDTNKGKVWRVMFTGEKEKFGAEQLMGMEDRKSMAHIRTPHEVDDNLQEEFTGKGQELYHWYCGACHQRDGKGASGRFPPLAGVDWVTGDKKRLIEIVLEGMEGTIEVAGESYNGVMPQHSFLDDEQISDVLNYIRSNFGNKASDIRPEEVAEVRHNMDSK